VFVALAPALSTILTSAVIGGAWGTAVAVEYEVLRTILKLVYGLGVSGMAAISGDQKDELAEAMFGESDFDEIFPPLSKLIFDGEDVVGSTLKSMYKAALPEGVQEKYPELAATASQYGVPTALTGPMMTELGELLGIDMSGQGFDVGSGTRFQPMAAALMEKGEVSIMDAMPVVKWWQDALFERLPMYIGGTDAEKYKAARNVSPVVGGRLAMDEMITQNRDYIPEIGKDGKEKNKEPYTNQARVAALFGSPTITSKRDEKQFVITQREQRISKTVDNRIQKALDARLKGKEFNLEPTLNLAAKIGLDKSQVAERMMTQMTLRKMDKDTRFKIGTNMSLSVPEMLRNVEVRKGEE
jgi:hypothetical protein